MNTIRPLGPAESIPVYNCQVLVGPAPEDAARIRARVANLEGIEALADSEREALQKVVTEFKARVAQYNSNGDPIPWLQPAHVAGALEQTRLIAIHL